MRKTKLLIIGSGPAGYTAGIYAGRAMLSPILVSGMEKGGQLTITTDVENYPGFAEGIQGPRLMEQMAKQCENSGCELLFDQIESISLLEKPFRAEGVLGTRIEAEAVIVCSGSKAKWLGLPSEKEFTGYGISSCATCDGNFFKDGDVCVVGGGNTAAEEAIYLSGICRKVTLIHRRDSLRAEKILQNKVFSTDNIDVVWNHVVEEFVGEKPPPKKKITGVVLRDVRSGAIRQLPVSGAFVAIGHVPATELFRDQLETDSLGYLGACSRKKCDERSRGFCGRGRLRRRLPSGDHGRRNGLHGRFGRRQVLGRHRLIPASVSLVKTRIRFESGSLCRFCFFCFIASFGFLCF